MQRISSRGIIGLTSGQWQLACRQVIRGQQTAPKAAKIEVFIDGKSVMVEPGMTILQVSKH